MFSTSRSIALIDGLCALGKPHECPHGFLQLFGPGRRVRQQLVDPLFAPDDLGQRGSLFGIKRERRKFRGRVEKLFAMHFVAIEQPLVTQNDHLVRDALHCGNELGKLAAVLRRLDGLVDRLLAQVPELVDRDRVVDEREHERQRDKREADEQQL
jgi:hypothetical protein